MKMDSPVLLFLILLSVSPTCQSWGWFSSSANNHNDPNSQTNHIVSGAEFTMKGLGDERGMKLIENAKHKMAVTGSNSCWQDSYQTLFAGCSQILAAEEKRSRFAWHLSDCFQKDSGRNPFPYCDTNSAMLTCLKKLSDSEHKVYLEFLLETNSICYQLQAHAFKHKMERLVNDLKDSAEYTEHQIEIIQERTSLLSESSSRIEDSLSSIDDQVVKLVHTTENVTEQMEVLSDHTEAVYEQSREISKYQSELQEGQARMNENLKEGMTTINDAYNNLGQQVGSLRNEALEIEKQIGKVGDAMSSKMQSLQNSADGIEDMAGKSLEKQHQLLDGQSTALKGLKLLTEFQTEALDESRSTLKQLAEYGQRQQEELLQRQEQLRQVHQHLVENSESILAAQEAFESKQASMFVALDKLFALHNAMLLESRIIKAFFIYSMSIFVIYMFTSTKQTYSVRARLYIGLCAAFAIEVAILRLVSNNIEQQGLLINLVRSIFLLLASLQFLHAIYTYRDYEVLNHGMILTLMDKVNAMQRSTDELCWEEDCDVNWSSWMKSEMLEGDDDCLEDPDFIVPEEIVEENSATTASSITRRYHLRSCSRQ